MTEEAQRVALAEVCGWKQVDPRRWGGYTDKWEPLCSPADSIGAPAKFWGYIPDYLHSLDAMHKAEKVLDADEILADKYARLLTQSHCGNTFMTIHATAAVKAAAILRTLNLWDDTK